MKVAQMLFGEKYKFNENDELESLDFTIQAGDGEEEESFEFHEPAFDSLKEVKNLEKI